MTAHVRGRGGLGNAPQRARQAGTEGHCWPTRPRWRDPAGLTPGERIAELGALLALGYRRARLRQKALAESAQAEALSGPAVDGDRAETAEEVA